MSIYASAATSKTKPIKANQTQFQSRFAENKPNQTQFKTQFQTCIAKRFQQNNQLSTIDNQSFPPTPALQFHST
jgi:hypothetical protein